MSDCDPPPLNCTKKEFVDAFKADGFLSVYIEEAIPNYVQQHHQWFSHAEALNRAGLNAYHLCDKDFVGLSSQHPNALALRMIYRALSAFQGALILYRRGMIAEGDTLARNVYEVAFWLGFIQKEGDVAVRALINNELKSQKAHLTYWQEQFRCGAYAKNPEMEQKIRLEIEDMASKISSIDDVSIKMLLSEVGFMGTTMPTNISAHHLPTIL